MNDLSKLTDDELKKAIDDLKERELAAKTNAGKTYILSKMRSYITMLEELGYTTTADELALAKLWAKGLEDEFVLLGQNAMQEAIERWAMNDDRQYKTFPQIPWIAEACKEMGGDPRAEQGRRIQAENERQMELDHKREMAELEKTFTPKQLEEIERKARELSEYSST